MNIEITLSGDYLQEVKFINALERDKMFFLIDAVALAEQQGKVRLQLKAGNLFARRDGHVMKLGTENKKKTIIALVLAVLAVVLLVRAFHGGEEDSTLCYQACSCCASGFVRGSRLHNRGAAIRQSARKTAHPLLAQTLDPTLRFDLLKSSEDVTYKGTGRDIFRSQPEEVAIPKPSHAGRATGPASSAASTAYRFEVLRLCQSQGRLQDGSFFQAARTFSSPKKATSWIGVTRSCTSDRTSVDVEDVLTNNRQTLPLVAS